MARSLSVTSTHISLALGLLWPACHAVAQAVPALPPRPALGQAGTPTAVPALPSVQDPGQRMLDDARTQQRQRELNAAPPQIETAPPSLPAAPNLPASADIELLPESGPTFLIDRIAFSGEKVLSEKQLDAVTRPFIGKYLGRIVSTCCCVD